MTHTTPEGRITSQNMQKKVCQRPFECYTQNDLLNLCYNLNHAKQINPQTIHAKNKAKNILHYKVKMMH